MKKVELKPIKAKARLTLGDLFTEGWEEIFSGEELVKAEEYVNKFVTPHYDESDPEHIKRHCCHCGSEMDGFKQALGLASAFRWEMVHGEASCSNCRYPSRAIHSFTLEGKTEPFLTLSNFYLEYFDVEVAP